MSAALLDHQLLIMNGYGKRTRHMTLHLAFQALHSFVASHRRLPLSHSDVSADAERRTTNYYRQRWSIPGRFLLSQADADALVAMVRELNAVARLEQLDEIAVRGLAYTARGDLAPMNAFIGGLAAQEVIKVSLTPPTWAQSFCFCRILCC